MIITAVAVSVEAQVLALSKSVDWAAIETYHQGAFVAIKVPTTLTIYCLVMSGTSPKEVIRGLNHPLPPEAGN